jgi:hypothetical protein
VPTSDTGWSGKTYRLNPSIVCARVCAEHRRCGHGGDTKLMACSRQGNKERGTARNSPAALVKHIRRRMTSRACECACTGSTRKNRASTRFSSLLASPSPPLLLSPCGGQGEIPKGGGGFWEMRLGTGISKATLGFASSRAGGGDAAWGHEEAIRGCQRYRGRQPWGQRSAPVASLPHVIGTGKG